MPKKNEYVQFKNYERQIKSQFIILQILKAFYYQKIMESKIQMNLVQTNIENILLAVKAIN